MGCTKSIIGGENDAARVRRQQVEQAQERRELEQERQRRELEQERQRRELEQERQRRQQLQQERQRRQQLEQEQQRRQQLECEKEKYFTALTTAANVIDRHIRTRNRFDTSNPLLYCCQLSSVRQCCDHDIHNLITPDIVPNFLALNRSTACVPLTIQFVIQYYRRRFNVTDTTISVLHLTPFQGDESHRVFGKFRCSCGRVWHSAATWKDKWQKCQKCDKRIFPHIQHVLEKSVDVRDAEDTRAPHDVARCQKCREIGKICVPSMYYAA